MIQHVRYQVIQAPNHWQTLRTQVLNSPFLPPSRHFHRAHAVTICSCICPYFPQFPDSKSSCCSKGGPKESFHISIPYLHTCVLPVPLYIIAHPLRRDIIKKPGIIIKTMFMDDLKLFIPGIPNHLKKEHFAEKQNNWLRYIMAALCCDG